MTQINTIRVGVNQNVQDWHFHGFLSVRNLIPVRDNKLSHLFIRRLLEVN